MRENKMNIDKEVALTEVTFLVILGVIFVFVLWFLFYVGTEVGRSASRSCVYHNGLQLPTDRTQNDIRDRIINCINGE